MEQKNNKPKYTNHDIVSEMKAKELKDRFLKLRINVVNKLVGDHRSYNLYLNDEALKEIKEYCKTENVAKGKLVSAIISEWKKYGDPEILTKENDALHKKNEQLKKNRKEIDLSITELEDKLKELK